MTQQTALDEFVSDVRSMAYVMAPLVRADALREDVVDDAVRTAVWLHKFDTNPGQVLQDLRYTEYCKEQDRKEELAAFRQRQALGCAAQKGPEYVGSQEGNHWLTDLVTTALNY